MAVKNIYPSKTIRYLAFTALVGVVGLSAPHQAAQAGPNASARGSNGASHSRARPFIRRLLPKGVTNDSFPAPETLLAATPRTSRAQNNIAVELNPRNFEQIQGAAMEILERFRPDEHVYVGVGRSPSALIAFFEAMDTDAPLSFDFPASGLGRMMREAYIDQNWPAFRQHIKKFLPDVFTSGKTILLIDRSDGWSPENLRYALNRYQAEIGTKVPIKTFSLYTDKKLVSAAERAANTYKGGTDFRLSRKFATNAFGEDQIGRFGHHQIGADPIESLVENAVRKKLVAGFRKWIAGSHKFDAFLAQKYPDLTEEVAQEPAAEPAASQLVKMAAKSLFRLAKPRREVTVVPGPMLLLKVTKDDATTSVQLFDDAEYRELFADGLQLLQRYPGGGTYFLGVGRSSTAITAFLESVSADAAGYLPMDGLQKLAKRAAKGDDSDERQAMYAIFQKFIPPELLQSNRTIVLHHRSESGRSLPFVKSMLQQWLASEGSTVQVKTLAFSTTATSNVDDNLLVKESSPSALDGYLSAAPYEFFRPKVDDLNDSDSPLKNGKPKAKSVAYSALRDAIAARLATDSRTSQLAQLFAQ